MTPPDCTGGALIKNGKILIVKRHSRERNYPNLYEFPGGKIDKKEKPEETIVREFEEETGLKIKVVKFVKNSPYIVKGVKGNTFETIQKIYLVEQLDGNEVKISKEHTEFHWIKPNQVEEFEGIPGFKEDVLDCFKAAGK